MPLHNPTPLAAHTRPLRAMTLAWAWGTALLCGTLVPSAQAASFDCRKASTFVEHAVCNNPELSALDEAMARNYNAMLASNLGDGGRQHLRNEQREWLKRRNTCRTPSCLMQMYRERVNSVCDMPVVSGVHANCINTEDVLAHLPQQRVSGAPGIWPLPEVEFSGAMCAIVNAQESPLVTERVLVNGKTVPLKLTAISPQSLRWSGRDTEVRYTVHSGKLLRTPNGFSVGTGPIGTLQVTHQGQTLETAAREMCTGSD